MRHLLCLPLLMLSPWPGSPSCLFSAESNSNKFLKVQLFDLLLLL